MLNSLYALILTDSLHLPTIIGYFNTRPAACQARQSAHAWLKGESQSVESLNCFSNFVIGHATFSPHQATFLRLEYLRKLVYNQNHKVTRQHETASLSAPHTAPTGRVSLWLCSFSPVFSSFLTAHPSLIIICSPPCPVWQVLFHPVIYKFS